LELSKYERKVFRWNDASDQWRKIGEMQEK
jgi:hypothetical protein